MKFGGGECASDYPTIDASKFQAPDGRTTCIVTRRAPLNSREISLSVVVRPRDQSTNLQNVRHQLQSFVVAS